MNVWLKVRIKSYSIIQFLNIISFHLKKMYAWKKDHWYPFWVQPFELDIILFLSTFSDFNIAYMILLYFSRFGPFRTVCSHFS